MNIEILDPQGISVGKRARVFDVSNMEMIKRSILDLGKQGLGHKGLINPITVTRFDNGQPDLICGLHRLRAIKDLGWTEVPCHMIRDVQDQQKRLLEIAENYCAGDLSTAERAEHAKEYAELAGWKLREKAGRPRENKCASGAHYDGKLNASKELAKKTGRSTRAVQEDLQIARSVDGSVLRAIAGTAIDSKRELVALGKLPKDKQRQIAKDWTNPKAKTKRKPTTLVGVQKRNQRQEKLASKITTAAEKLGEQMYGIIVADPPWERWTYSEAGKSRDPANHYPTQSEEYLAKLPVPAAPDCVLFLWSTMEHLAQAIHLIDSWRFEYKSGAVWAKPSISTGYWFRTKHELVLVATKGHPVAPAQGTQIPSVFEAPVGEHSEKPLVIHEMVERLWPDIPKLEMFARGEPRKGWSAWGAEVEDFQDLKEANK